MRAYINRGLRSFHSLTPVCKLSPFQGFTTSYKFTSVSESCKLSSFWDLAHLPHQLFFDEGFTASYKFTSVSESCKLSSFWGLAHLPHQLFLMKALQHLTNLPLRVGAMNYPPYFLRSASEGVGNRSGRSLP